MTTATTTAVSTKHADRRELRFNSVDDLVAELDRIQAAHDAGTLTSTGNWSPGQNLQHCARVWRCGLEGFPPEMKPPAIFKFFAKLMYKKRATAGQTAPAGIRLPKVADPIMPDPQGVSFDTGMREFRAEIARTQRGERFTAVSPIFGAMTHDEWTRLQLGHCQLHLGFLKPG